MTDCDVLVIGAGHNALVCAGYLAQAGYRVLVLERRHIVGGAVVTEEIVQGFKFDLGGSAHILIHHTPIIQDLQLDKYGLHYIDIDPLFCAFYPITPLSLSGKMLIRLSTASPTWIPKMPKTINPFYALGSP